MIHWRTQLDSPQPWEVPEKDYSYPHFDLAQQEGLKGVPIKEYTMRASAGGCSVDFLFANGRRIIFKDEQDNVSYAVI